MITKTMFETEDGLGKDIFRDTKSGVYSNSWGFKDLIFYFIRLFTASLEFNF